MKHAILLTSLLWGSLAHAAIYNKTGESLDTCELAAVYGVAEAKGYYAEPNESEAILTQISQSQETPEMVSFELDFIRISDGDSPTNQPFSDTITINKTQYGYCALPNLAFSIIKEPKSKCVATYTYDSAAYCNESLDYMVQVLGIDDYDVESELAIPDHNQVLIDVAWRRLIEVNPMIFDKPEEELLKTGKFTVNQVTQLGNQKTFVAVRWIHYDDFSYTVFMEKEYPNHIAYVYYEN